MVLLAAAICTKQGKALVSRQFVEMSRSRIEGLLSAFPKLMNTGRQHTFVETESVRYVYQPLELLYMLLITTKASNILEDLETLRLFSRVIPEYCQSLDEHDVSENAFDLISAFDEIVALGYRESVNLAQIRTFTEMDSHEERVFEAMRKTQEREAKEEMKRRAKELTQAKREAKKMGGAGGGGRYGGGYSGIGSHSYGGGGGTGYSPVVSDTTYEPSKPSYTSRPTGGGMKLGKKTKDADSFVDKLVAEGEKVVSVNTRQTGSSAKAPPTGVQQSVVHLKINEHLTVAAGRDGGLQTMEILGMITLRISDGEYGRVTIAIDHANEQRGIQFQTHPNVDKRLFQDNSVISLKGEGKSFPIGQDIGVLKWRLQTNDDSLLPLFINCWPSENAGSCDVNVEYELLQEYLELNQVIISIPVQSGTPVIGDIDGEHHYDTRKRILEWCVPIIDSKNKTGSLEFTVPGAHPDDFFPIKVTFGSSRLYCHVQVSGIKQVEDNRPVDFSSEIAFSPDKFEIV